MNTEMEMMQKTKKCSICSEAHRQLRTKRNDAGKMKPVCLACFYALGD